MGMVTKNLVIKFFVYFFRDYIWWAVEWVREPLERGISSKLRLVLEGKEITVTPPTVPLSP